MTICWHDDRMPWRHRCPGRDQTDPYRVGESITWGRCRSGRRWFWAVSVDLSDSRQRLEGKADTEAEAITAARAAVVELAGGQPATARPGHGYARRRLTEINAEIRAARTSAGTTDTTVVEHLYVPCTYIPYDDALAETRRWVAEIPVVRKTRKRIWFAERDAPKLGDGWGAERHKLCWIDREEFERTGKASIPSSRWYDPGHVAYASKEEAERKLRLFRPEADPATVAEIRRLRAEAANAHPDRGGSSEEFRAAYARYERAKRAAGRAAYHFRANQ